MATATVQAGICGFTTVIDAQCDEDQEVTLTFKTDCPNYADLNGKGFTTDAYAASFGKVGEGAVYELLRPHCRHAACPVPSGAVKAIEVAAGVALPKDVHIEIRR
jgi:hypothetical protein